MRLDLLKLVGSNPAALARPEADMCRLRARASIADQIWAWVKAIGTKLP
jgi:hypothetical protein